VLIGSSTTSHDVSVGDPPFMVDVGGQPFLAYLVDLLRDEGFSKILMVIGGATAAVREYFGSGDRRGIRITYSMAMEPRSPAAALRAAQPLLEDHFLLLDGDTYWPLKFEPMWRDYTASDTLVMTTVYSNRDSYAIDTVKVKAGLIEMFDPTGQTPAHGHDIGYAIVQREALDVMSAVEGSVESALYPPLIERRALAAYPTEHRFYSINTPERLALTRIFLARKPAVILDGDGVLNRRPTPGGTVRTVGEFEWLPGALDALRAFREAGYRVIVACLARGQVSVNDLEAIHDLMRRDARDAGGSIDAIYQCPHDWYAGCDCRKPRPGLLFQIQRDFWLDLTRTIVFGDDEAAMRAAAAAGAIGRLVTWDAPLIVHAREILHLRTPA
jgi:D-glycero-D-manno-heptose 1,7-bisphosphate phosphatase